MKTRAKAEFGDFQTPLDLTRQICDLLAKRRIEPAAVIEPTCGRGSFLVAALETFPSVRTALGIDINAEHVSAAAEAVRQLGAPTPTRFEQASFFNTDWRALIADLPEPLLIVGNPPWVTNAELGGLGSENLPAKSNFQNHVGLDAITGKSNFDISEWMLIRLLESLQDRAGTLAMLCKTAVARKILSHAWKTALPIASADIYRVDAPEHFQAAVDACLLVCRTGRSRQGKQCVVHPDLTGLGPTTTVGYRDGRLLADVQAFERWKHLEGQESWKWRSGIKHDCSSVMELRREGSAFRNGFDHTADLEEHYVYPMLKGSEIANGRVTATTRWMLVPQRTVRDDTSSILRSAPKTWHYLQEHGALLDRRASSIYKNRPRFCVFGVGDYSFAPWKVAVAALYKRLSFTVVGPIDGKPVVFDDTVYFLPCQTSDEAGHLALLLNSPTATAFLRSFIFWDAKRPITAEVLGRLDLRALSREMGQPLAYGRSAATSSATDQLELL